MKKLLLLFVITILAMRFTWAQSTAPCTQADMLNPNDSTYKVRQPLIISDDGMMSGFSLDLTRVNNLLTITAEPFGKGLCLNQDSNVELLFKDGTKSLVSHQYSGNDCDKILKINFDLDRKYKALDRLTAQPLYIIKINGKENYLQTTINNDNARDIKAMINCMVNF